jgi:hypothetical protein
MTSAQGIIADQPQRKHKDIDAIRVFQTDNDRIKVATEKVVWATFFGKYFLPEWNDKQIIAQLEKHLDGLKCLHHVVARGMRHGQWQCSVRIDFESPEEALVAATCLRKNGFKAGACRPTQIVNRVIHDIGTSQFEYSRYAIVGLSLLPVCVTYAFRMYGFVSGDRSQSLHTDTSLVSKLPPCHTRHYHIAVASLD